MRTRLSHLTFRPTSADNAAILRLAAAMQENGIGGAFLNRSDVMRLAIQAAGREADRIAREAAEARANAAA